jgi:hypothetical protein
VTILQYIKKLKDSPRRYRISLASIVTSCYLQCNLHNRIGIKLRTLAPKIDGRIVRPGTTEYGLRAPMSAQP